MILLEIIIISENLSLVLLINVFFMKEACNVAFNLLKMKKLLCLMSCHNIGGFVYRRGKREGGRFKPFAH